MMKRGTRRVLSVFLAALLLVGAVRAARAEGPAETVYNAAARLLFETENAALGIRADFSYNGKLFKSLEGSYVQDGLRSLMQVQLKTPANDGSVFASGYTVAAEDGMAYAINPIDNPFVYTEVSAARSANVLSNTLLRGALMRFGGAAVRACEDALSQRITVSDAENGSRQYRLRMTGEETPALLNGAGTLLSQIAAKHFFYVDYNEPDTPRQYCDVFIVDYEALRDVLYEQMYGEKRPKNFDELLWNRDGTENRNMMQRNREMARKIEEMRFAAETSHAVGVAQITPTGDTVYYPTRTEFILENGLQEVSFEDQAVTFRRYYEKKTGTPLTARDFQVIMASDNPDLKEAYSSMWKEMQREYQELLSQDEQAAILHVNPDGTYRMVYDADAYNLERAYRFYTPTQRILQTMRELSLREVDAQATLDAQGRVTAASGRLSLTVTDLKGEENILEIVFDATVGQYGESRLAPFDPQEYGVMSWMEFMELQERGEAELPYYHPPVDEEYVPLPETFEFDGVKYQVKVEEPWTFRQDGPGNG